MKLSALSECSSIFYLLKLICRYKDVPMPTHGRNLHLDNVKAVLIFLVVFGHLIELYIEHDNIIRSVWIFIYSFHMPMFALVSGMFSKAALNEMQTRQLIKSIVIPLVAFELLYEGLEIITTGKPSNYFSLIAPYWMLWYLLSLLSWRLMLPIFSKMRFPVMIAIVISLIASYSDNTGYFLSISRTLTFFPFFLLGWRLGDGFLSSPNKKVIGFNIAILIIALVASFMVNTLDHRWLYGSYSLASLNMTNITGVFYQLLLYVISTLVGLSVLNLITRKDVGIARMGQHSIYIYLWHGFAILALSQTHVLNAIFSLNGTLAMAILALISIAIMAFASHALCISFTNKCIINPLLRLLLKEPKNDHALAPRA
jgi:fucose 4-O-acetylase-like acetyltransferase